MSKWEDIKMYDLSIPIGVSTPPWPTYEPLQVKYFKRLAPNGANGQLLTHSNHLGTHLDGPRHFDTAGKAGCSRCDRGLKRSGGGLGNLYAGGH